MKLKNVVRRVLVGRRNTRTDSKMTRFGATESGQGFLRLPIRFDELLRKRQECLSGRRNRYPRGERLKRSVPSSTSMALSCCVRRGCDVPNAVAAKLRESVRSSILSI